MTGKVAVITGASQGIGAGVVAGYRGLGWAVVASSRAIRPSDDPELLTLAGDISKPGTAERIVDSALARFGRIDTLVNNAGVATRGRRCLVRRLAVLAAACRFDCSVAPVETLVSTLAGPGSGSSQGAGQGLHGRGS